MTCARAALVLLLAIPLAALAERVSPSSLKYRGYVNDFAEVIDPQWEERLNRLATVLDQKTKAQIAVVTLASLEGEPVEDFANRLLEAWGVGRKGDVGLLLLLVIKERRARIEVGYGLEPIIPDGYAGSVLREMGPALGAGKHGEALYAGVSLLAERIALRSGVKLNDSGLAVRRRAAPRANRTALVLLLAALFFFGILPWWMPGMGTGYRRRRWWDTGYYGGFGGFGGYDGGGSGGGFGGFGGFGGGSSGGGGASSGW